MRKPTRIDSGMPTKNTCICGISRDRMPSPRLNRSPNTRNGAAICTPMRKAPATVVVSALATSPSTGISPGLKMT